MKTSQDIAEENWCKMMGLVPTEFNKMLAPVLAGEWEDNKKEDETN